MNSAIPALIALVGYVIALLMMHGAIFVGVKVPVMLPGDQQTVIVTELILRKGYVKFNILP